MTRPIPAWYDDAKLGIFIHWGIFSVPAYAPRGRAITDIVRSHPEDGWARLPYTEWYPNSLRFPQSPVAAHHRARYGDRSYESFRPDFDTAAEAFDAKAWAGLFAEAGAKYTVLVTKHHDGYCLWPTGIANPHRPGWHAKRDFVGELADASRAAGLTFGTYYSGGLDWTFRHHPIGTFGDMLACVPYEDDYAAYSAAQFRELVDRYGSDVLWNDIAWPNEDTRTALFDYFYAVKPDGVINDRWMANRGLFEAMRQAGPRAALNARIQERWAKGEGDITPDSGSGDFKTAEYSSQFDYDRKWEACRGMDLSFGFNAEARPEDYLTKDELIRSFVETVAHGGNLLLNMGPRADGSVPDEQQALLRALGAWLKVNGAAIYGTHKTAAPRGVTSDGTPYRLTQKGDTTYVLLLARPRGRFTLPTVFGAGHAARLDGGRVALQGGDAVTLVCDTPFADEPVHAIALTGAGVRESHA
ncbi:MAG: alpha-L-fucosidase [Alphaproteobacteria bacterium]|nr:alpha-L-fucosidase [Alphaproteobacteria bacterium]